MSQITLLCSCLQGNWNDYMQIRSKLTQDLLKSAGGLAPRIEYARLSVNGEFFGLYSIEESLKHDWASCFGMDMEAKVRDRDECQDVGRDTDARAVESACVAAGACAAVTAAGSKGGCRPPLLTSSVLARMHDRRQCRMAFGHLDPDCCAAKGQGECSTGYTLVQGDPCSGDPVGYAFSFYCVDSSAIPQCETEIPWVERDHCSWDARCDSEVANTDPSSGGFFCHDSEANCREACTSPGSYTGTWCPGRPLPPPLPEGQCPPGCVYEAPVLRCDSAALASDPIEVGKSTILKNDHGDGGGWPPSCGEGRCFLVFACPFLC